MFAYVGKVVYLIINLQTLTAGKGSFLIWVCLPKIFGTYSDHELKKIYPIADKIEALRRSTRLSPMPSSRRRPPSSRSGCKTGKPRMIFCPEAFATVREAADRVLGLRPHRVQLIGGIVPHQGHRRDEDR